MFCLSSLGSNQLVFLASLVAIALSDNLDADDLNVLGNFVAAVGALILTKAAKLTVESSQQDMKQQIDDLEQQIKRLKDRLKK